MWVEVLQEPEQHAALLVHAWLSDLQAVASHTLPLQLRVQQSVGALHGVPVVPHLSTTELHWCVVLLRSPEQQLLPLAHVLPVVAQEMVPPSGDPPPVLPPVPELPALAPAPPPVALPPVPAAPPVPTETSASGCPLSSNGPPSFTRLRCPRCSHPRRRRLLSQTHPHWSRRQNLLRHRQPRCLLCHRREHRPSMHRRALHLH